MPGAKARDFSRGFFGALKRLLSLLKQGGCYQKHMRSERGLWSILNCVACRLLRKRCCAKAHRYETVLDPLGSFDDYRRGIILVGWSLRLVSRRRYRGDIRLLLALGLLRRSISLPI